MSGELNIIVDIISIITGVAGLVFGLAGYRMSKGNIAKEFFAMDNSEEMREARNHVYNSKKAETKEEKIKLYLDYEFAKVCSHYHILGQLVNRKYFKLWFFEGAIGDTVIRCHEKSTQYLTLRRDGIEGETQYAAHKEYAKCFDELSEKIKKNRK